jgi:arginyl-tRNA synthetase
VLIHKIESIVQDAFSKIFPEEDPSQAILRPCVDSKFGDYQMVAIMPLAKSRKMNPRALAQELMDALSLDEYCEKVEVAGPGFINFHLRLDRINASLTEALAAESVSGLVAKPKRAQKIVVDFSSPNVAKPMHVGHIRSTILGDCLSRVFRALGHDVVSDNHIGDWGTQFGKLLVGWKKHLDADGLERDPLGEMERLYKKVDALAREDETVLADARAELVKLQGGDEENLRIWREMIQLSQRQFDTVYGRLGVGFDETLGESFYNDRLKSVVDRLMQGGIGRESDGAKMVFFDGPGDSAELKSHPAMILKSDGAANYTTTDLATLEYRLEKWSPDHIVYVTDGRQQLHFKQLFAIFKKWMPEAKARLDHVWFGSILGEDGKPFKTRSGETIKLVDLLNEAEERGYQVVTEKNPDLPEAERREIGRIVGLGAIKYADLAPNRQSDYVFSWDKMLALTGNTAVYLLYAYTRIQSIFRKFEATQNGDSWKGSEIRLEQPSEVALGKALLQYEFILNAVANERRPNYLCSYLYELAGAISKFYDECSVLHADDLAVRNSRLALCELTGRALKAGLNLLGIETTDRM